MSRSLSPSLSKALFSTPPSPFSLRPRFSSSSSLVPSLLLLPSRSFASSTSSPPPPPTTKRARAYTATQVHRGAPRTELHPIDSAVMQLQMESAKSTQKGEVVNGLGQLMGLLERSQEEVPSYFKMLHSKQVAEFFREEAPALLSLLSTASLAASAIDTVTTSSTACLPSLYRLLQALQRMVLELYGDEKNVFVNAVASTAAGGVSSSRAGALQGKAKVTTDSLSELESWLQITTSLPRSVTNHNAKQVVGIFEMEQQQLKAALNLLTNHACDDAQVTQEECKQLVKLLDPYLKKLIKAVHVQAGVRS